MFGQQTTIILGAGASQQYGFPVGEQLQDEIIQDIYKLESDLRIDRHLTSHVVPENNAYEFLHQPLVTICAYMLRQPAGDLMPNIFEWGSHAQAMFAFRDKLLSQTHDTVDRFIRDNPRYNYIGKLLIAASIIPKMYNYEPPVFKIKTFHERDYDNRRNWYHRLINKLQEPVRNTLWKMSNVTIATFNYDHSLEQALKSQLGKTEVHSSGDKVYQSPTILHVNGGMETLPETATDVVKLACKFADSIRLIDEDPNDHIHTVRRAAVEAISASERVFIIGFAFDEANVHTLGLRDYQHKGSMFCHNYDGNLGVTNNFLQLTGYRQNLIAGSIDAPLHIHEAIKHGFLDR
jgi:hypothetical protein